MTIDERIEKLTERHEALTQTVELLTRDVNTLREAVLGLKDFTNDIAEGTARLLAVAQVPQRRLNDHDDRISRLEGTL